MASKQPAIAPARFLIVLITYLVLIFIIVLNIISIRPTLDDLYDFGSFIAAGKEAIAGRDPYTLKSPRVHHIASEVTGQTLPSPNLNPPLSVVFFRGMANADAMQAASSWRIISTVLFAIGILALAWCYQRFTTPLRILWAACSAGFWITVSLGQIYAPLFLLTIGIWILTERGRNIGAGILLGALIAIKPNFAFWLLLLVLAGYIQVILSALITIVVLSIVPILIIGSQVYQQWIVALSDYPSLGLMIAGNSSLQSLAARCGNVNVGILLSIILAGSGVYYTHHHKPLLHLNEINSLGIISSLLISPFSWPGYTIFTLPIFFSKQHWKWREKVAAACLVFPYILILNFFQRSFFNSIVFGWLYGWGLLLMLAEIIIERRKKHIADFQWSNA